MSSDSLKERNVIAEIFCLSGIKWQQIEPLKPLCSSPIGINDFWLAWKDMDKMSDKGMRWDNIWGFGWRFNLRIRSVPGNNTLPRTISAIMQPTDQTSTEKWNDNNQISMQDWKQTKKQTQIKRTKGSNKDNMMCMPGDMWYVTIMNCIQLSAPSNLGQCPT